MRKVTQGVVGVLSLGVLAASWSLGQAGQSGFVVGAPSTAPSTPPTSAPSVAPSTVPSAAPTSASSTAPTSAPSVAPAPAKSITKNSDPISYVAHQGQSIMEISVTKQGPTILDITIIKGGTEGGEYAAVPSTLARAAVQAQGANFGNVGGATHTTDAFKKALETALAKF